MGLKALSDILENEKRACIFELGDKPHKVGRVRMSWHFLIMDAKIDDIYEVSRLVRKIEDFLPDKWFILDKHVFDLSREQFDLRVWADEFDECTFDTEPVLHVQVRKNENGDAEFLGYEKIGVANGK